MHKSAAYCVLMFFVFASIVTNSFGQLVPNEPLIAYNSSAIPTICQGVPVKIQMQAGSCPGTDLYQVSINGQSGTYQTVTTAPSGFLTAYDATNRIVTVNTTNASGSIWVRMTSCGCSIDQQAYIVNPAPVVNPGAGTICSGNSYAYAPTSTPSGATYTWSAPIVTGISGTTAGTDASTFSSGTLTSTNVSATVVTYSVTPKVGTCLGTPFNVAVTVTPLPTASISYAGSPFCATGTGSVT
ncbi:MAG: hypothetical protein EBS86_12695, partial [Crocinitomicaceae bacterium]|nr:hypothetical protein [Crocinitomicaceae bacterium]